MTANHDSLCWRPDWQVPFESLWSLLKKFGYLNAAAYPDIRDLIRRPAPEKAPARQPRIRRDLNSFAPVDDEKLKQFFLIDPIALRQSIAVAYIRPDEISALTSNQLRYCVPCIQAGFHSAIHQLLFLSHCPIHLSPLMTRCMTCGVMSPRYTLTSLTQRFGKNCSDCFGSFTKNFLVSYQSKNLKESRELIELASWLEERLSANWIENYMFVGSFFHKPSKCRHKKLRRLPHYWASPLPFSSDSLGSRLPDREHHHSLSTTAEPELIEPLLDQTGRLPADFELDLQRDFRAISRNLLRHVLRKHRRCVRQLQKHVCWVVPSRYWRGRMCVAANAYLLWLMRCQNINDPTQLFHRKMKLRILPVHAFIQKNRPLSRSAFRRILALNWSSLFYEALLVSYGLNRKGLYSLCPGLVEGVRRPYWLVEWSSGERQVLHWWMENRFTDRIASDRKLCPGPASTAPPSVWRTNQCTCLS